MTVALSFKNMFLKYFGIKAERHAHARASSLKFRNRNGAAKLSRPCQYTRPGNTKVRFDCLDFSVPHKNHHDSVT